MHCMRWVHALHAVGACVACGACVRERPNAGRMMAVQSVVEENRAAIQELLEKRRVMQARLLPPGISIMSKNQLPKMSFPSPRPPQPHAAPPSQPEAALPDGNFFKKILCPSTVTVTCKCHYIARYQTAPCGQVPMPQIRHSSTHQARQVWWLSTLCFTIKIQIYEHMITNTRQVVAFKVTWLYLYD
jgi:ferredoxin